MEARPQWIRMKGRAFFSFLFSSKSYTFLSTSNIAIVKNHTHTFQCVHTTASKGGVFKQLIWITRSVNIWECLSSLHEWVCDMWGTWYLCVCVQNLTEADFMHLKSIWGFKMKSRFVRLVSLGGGLSFMNEGERKSVFVTKVSASGRKELFWQSSFIVQSSKISFALFGETVS